MVGWRQAAVLAAIALAVLAALALTGAATADDGEQAAEPPALQPTQVVAEIPEGYNQLFPFQWGGGSLFQLKSRLATMGCIANTIWNYDGGEWHGYNQYNVPSTLNADWLAAYEEFVPAGSLYATCFDVCEFNYFDAPRLSWQRCHTAFVAMAREQNAFSFPIDDSSECTDDFDERVKEHVLPSMPLYPNVCIIRQSTPEVRTGAGEILSPLAGDHGAVNDQLHPFDLPIIVVYTKTVPPTTERGHVAGLSVEIHELCHANQFYHFLEQMRPDRLTRSSGDGGTSSGQWRMTKPGSSFIELVSFKKYPTGDWRLLGYSSFRSLYSINPTELAAELCAMYFLDRMGERNTYEWTLENFDPGRYLTDEIVDWIETWVVLPAITAAEAD